MCGIAGSLNFPLPIKRVQDLLAHRGPDEQTSWSDRGLQFIHARLAIQELSEAGRQPMHRGPLHIIFNGEIYNHFELREKHQLQCGSHSDTETLLHLFEKIGVGMLNELDGMFAMSIYDERSQKLWLCRDRAGEKPLYYFMKQDTLVFASELRVLSSILKPEIEVSHISTFLTVGFLPTTQTPYKNIMELPPATYAEVDISTMKVKVDTWWNIESFYKQESAISLEEALDETDRLLNLSVKRRMLSSDLEVGTFLSGGIDSGLVTAMASKHTDKLKTFTVSFDGLYNEAPLAASVANHLGTQHHEIRIGLDNLENDLETIFANYGEPMMDDSIIPSYYVAREARKHLTVVLNGDAGDELFAGYRRYVPFTRFDLFSPRGTAVVKALKSMLPPPSDKMNYYNYLYRLVNLFSTQGAETYFSATNDLLHEHKDVFLAAPNTKVLRDSIARVAALKISPLKRMLLLDFMNILPAILLVKMDIATMAHSLEGRSPFLSKELLEFTPMMPDQFKVKGHKSKFILRELAAKYLPAAITTQPKRGFEVPLRSWVDTRFKNIIQDYVGAKNAFVNTVIDPAFIRGLLDKKDPSVHPEQRAKILFAMLSVECWYKNNMR